MGEFCLINKATMERTAGASANPNAIIRASIHTFLKNYRHFNTITILVLLPYSASILLSRTTTMMPLNLRGSETITVTTSVLQVVFTMTFLVLAKSTIIGSLSKHPQDRIFPSFFQLYGALLKTQIGNSVLSIAANSTVFILFSIAHKSSSILTGFPSASTMLVPLLRAAITYTITINLSVINNMSLVISGHDSCSTAAAIGKACKLRWRDPRILVPAAFSNLCFVGVEALFWYRVISDHRSLGSPGGWGMIGEVFLLSYMYSEVIILDVVACCLFLKRHSADGRSDDDDDDNDADGFHYVGMNSDVRSSSPYTSV